MWRAPAAAAAGGERTKRAQLCFCRKENINIDFDAYKAYRAARNRPPIVPPAPNSSTAPPPQAPSAAPPTSDAAAGGIMPAPAGANEPAAPYPTSFAHIVELITSGKPVPGIKDIPPTVLTGQGTQPAQARRKKPWEKDAPQVDAQEESQTVAPPA